MRPTLLLAAGVLLFGCKKTSNDTSTTSHDTGTTDTSSSDTGTTTDTTDTAFNSWSGADNGQEAPSRAPDDVIYGNLSDGEVLTDLSWGESASVACWASPGASFTGAHVFYQRDQPEQTDLYVRLVPQQGLDMSLYVMQRSAGSTTLPPDATLGGGGDCDSSYDSHGNPSQPEVACTPAFTGYTYSVLIGVAGADGLTSGPFELEVWQNAYTGCIKPNG